MLVARPETKVILETMLCIILTPLWSFGPVLVSMQPGCKSNEAAGLHMPHSHRL